MIGGWVYLMADRYRGTLYVGVTSDIAARVFAHRQGRGSAFCARYRLDRLVYVEQAPTIGEAIAREKALKTWNRASKIELIESANPVGKTSGARSTPDPSPPRKRGSRCLVPCLGQKRDSRFRGNDN